MRMPPQQAGELNVVVPRYLSRGGEALQQLATAHFKRRALTRQAGEATSTTGELARREAAEDEVLTAAAEIVHIAVALGLVREPSGLEQLSWLAD